jgi:hypothetical protein
MMKKPIKRCLIEIKKSWIFTGRKPFISCKKKSISIVNSAF